MISKPSLPASVKYAALMWICLTPTARKRSKPSEQFPVRYSFDVLYLLPQFFNLRLDLQPQSRDGQRFALDTWCFGKHRVRFAMHFLQEKIEFLAELPRPVQQLSKLMQVAAQTVELFTDIASLRQDRR